MTYTQQVKKELSILPINLKTSKSELSAILRLNGIYHLGNANGNTLEVQTQNPASARRTYQLLAQTYETDIQTNIERGGSVKIFGLHRYGIITMHKADEILLDLQLDPFSITHHVPSVFLNSQAKQQAFLRAAFLSTGSVNAPRSKDYHLEIASSDDDLIQQIMLIMNNRHFNLGAKIAERRNKKIIYLKTGERISDFLSIIQATSAMLAFEDARIMSDMRNSANRLANADNANVTRMTEAAEKQYEAMNFLRSIHQLETMPDKLKIVGELRLQYPEASLSDLAELVENQELTKSGINHRMRKLMQIAKELRATKV
ncbi:DNA-binding protein WhiA [Oenococcus sicerae]|uniref:Probable cell division protein WhiA n=1 Tax=Oenococcus sicerae TaxID=2203724 RepID=A0AAJ1RAX5_9LACO|nr:DNA-binding protein WhiA [Oenococcus sicerae]MDN6900976.1 DNA-binding protein WhiA [Oenococcus sicerae]QAS70012.1 DNA-binding protein WhiA [Oenococcus sicerae]